jgi:hypothetical protein
MEAGEKDHAHGQHYQHHLVAQLQADVQAAEGGEEEEDGALRLTAQLTLERIVMAARGTGAGGEAPIMVYTAALSSSY